MWTKKTAVFLECQAALICRLCLIVATNGNSQRLFMLYLCSSSRLSPLSSIMQGCLVSPHSLHHLRLEKVLSFNVGTKTWIHLIVALINAKYSIVFWVDSWWKNHTWQQRPHFDHMMTRLLSKQHISLHEDITIIHNGTFVQQTRWSFENRYCKKGTFFKK